MPRNPPSYAAPPVEGNKSGRAHLRQQERQSSKGGSNTPLAAPPVGRDYVVTPDGQIFEAAAYRPGIDILVCAGAA